MNKRPSDQMLREGWEEGIIIECRLSVSHAASCCVTLGTALSLDLLSDPRGD